MSDEDKNSLAFWFPKIEEAGLPVPRTTIIRTESNLTPLLDGKKPEGWDELLSLVQAACYDHGLPCFLRTGHGSGKHEWLSTCYVEAAERVGFNIVQLVQWSHYVDLMGLPTDVWAVRDLIPGAPPFVMTAYENFPWAPEWRFFVRNGEVEHVQRYWPPKAIEQGRPDRLDWIEVVDRVCSGIESDHFLMSDLQFKAGQACQAVGGGYWSVDFLYSPITESFWLTDMADGDRSYRYDG